jgi:molybdate transport system regulatory protein
MRSSSAHRARAKPGRLTRITLRLDFAPDRRLGPGKVQLLEEIAEQGSISAAGRALGMSYRRAWLLVENLNAIFAGPVVAASAGGSRGGGAVLTPLGESVVRHYRALERATLRAGAGPLRALEHLRRGGAQ